MATGRRSVAQPDRRPTAGHHVQPVAPAKGRGRQCAGGISRRVRRRSESHLRHGDARTHARVRPLPRPQIRPDLAEGVLPVLFVFQHHRRVRPVLLLHAVRSHANATDEQRCREGTNRCREKGRRKRGSRTRENQTSSGRVVRQMAQRPPNGGRAARAAWPLSV